MGGFPFHCEGGNQVLLVIGECRVRLNRSCLYSNYRLPAREPDDDQKQYILKMAGLVL